MSDLKLAATAITIDPESIKHIVDQAVENSVVSAISTMAQDPAWLDKIERLINQATVQRTVATIGSMDISTIIKQRVDENMERFQKSLLENFSSTGIDDRATQCQLTVMDETTVVENKLTANSAEVVTALTVQDLVVKGSINTDNRSWLALADAISEKTMTKLDQDWKQSVIDATAARIAEQGIDVGQIKVGDTYLVSGNRLGKTITESSLERVGTLKDLKTTGTTALNDTLVVVNDRVGINTAEPESALTVWDEEITIGIGKHQKQEAYVGTTRNQSLSLVVNRQPQITLGTDGETRINRLRVGQFCIGHSAQVPGWSGTRGDIMFNSNPVPGSDFAWVCLGAFKWKALRIAE